MNFLDITQNFGISDIFSVDELKSGHINKTYLINKKYVLQSVNRDIFKNPEIIMNNISLIEKAFADEKNIAVLHYLSCNGKNYTEQGGEIWRICGYIRENPDAENKNYSYGYAVGRFLRVVNTSGFEFENPVNLHNFGLNLTIRNIHGDTKIDNIIFGEKITIIDFDTAMRGYICTDYGDMIRSATNKSFDLQTVYQITEGFADGLDGLLIKSEIDSLYNGIILVISELIERYHAGNKNFPNKTHEECRERENQLNLQLDEFYRYRNDIIKIIDECFS